jgi:hypothetical protein
VKDCTYAIDFNLKDVNPKSDRYGEEYGLYYSEKTDVILVGMYMADSADSVNNAKRQQELGQELMDMGYTVKNVLLNYYAPLGCVMEGECVSFWWNNPFLFPGSDNCAGYVSGCAPNDERLTYAKWQGLLADAVDLPIFIYNIPARSVVDMSVETMARLAKHRNIAGVKDATANLTRPQHTTASCGEDFVQLSGEDHTALPFLAAGGHGVISVTGNIAPRLCSQMHAHWHAGRIKEAMAIQARLLPLHDAMFAETNPAPVKYGASLLGFGTQHARLPMAPITAATAERAAGSSVAVASVARVAAAGTPVLGRWPATVVWAVMAGWAAC